ncbi:MAG: hypothetical protein IVW51_14335 [Thermaceae bacterium]|nr:hypothetical protein [Thermaceae bacterium]
MNLLRSQDSALTLVLTVDFAADVSAILQWAVVGGLERLDLDLKALHPHHERAESLRRRVVEGDVKGNYGFVGVELQLHRIHPHGLGRTGGSSQ